MFYPGSDHCSIPDQGGKKAPDPGSGIKASRIPDPGGKKSSGSRIRIRNTVSKFEYFTNIFLRMFFEEVWGSLYVLGFCRIIDPKE
jgi:hypothetical protein